MGELGRSTHITRHTQVRGGTAVRPAGGSYRRQRRGARWEGVLGRTGHRSAACCLLLKRFSSSVLRDSRPKPRAAKQEPTRGASLNLTGSDSATPVAGESFAQQPGHRTLSRADILEGAAISGDGQALCGFRLRRGCLRHLGRPEALPQQVSAGREEKSRLQGVTRKESKDLSDPLHAKKEFQGGRDGEAETETLRFSKDSLSDYILARVASVANRNTRHPVKFEF